jgi:HSP20 family protein
MYNHPFANRFCGKMMNPGGPKDGARWTAPWMRHFAAGNQPPANISQDDEAFTIAIYAAGIRKEDVRVTAKDDVLTVSYEPAAPDTRHHDDDERHEEWTQQGFRRRFALNGKVVADKMSARYTDGVLTITLPKNPDTNTPKVSVTVA